MFWGFGVSELHGFRVFKVLGLEGSGFNGGSIRVPEVICRVLAFGVLRQFEALP